MMKWLAAPVVLGAVLLGTACEHPPKEDCKRICWHAGELQYWKQIDDKLAKETDPDEKQVIREEAQEKWAEIRNKPMNSELNRCVITCQKDGRPKQVECIDAAKTSEDVTKCMSM